MFMFTFSVLTISIVGLFFQVVQAVTAYLLALQLGLGEQMLKWHSIAFHYSCTPAGILETDNSMITKADVGRTTELAGMYDWKTEVFTGTYAGASRRMIVTYVLPTDKPSGYAAADVARQLLKVTNKQHYRFTRVTGGSLNLITYDNGTAFPITIAGLPVEIVNNSIALVSDVTCN